MTYIIHAHFNLDFSLWVSWLSDGVIPRVNLISSGISLYSLRLINFVYLLWYSTLCCRLNVYENAAWCGCANIATLIDIMI